MLPIAPLALGLLLVLVALVPAWAVPRRTLPVLEERRLDLGLVGLAVLFAVLVVLLMTR